MKDRGKAAVVETTYYGDMPCMKHPTSSSIGICSYCLKERLENLLCSACGEQRLSSSSCSCFVEVGSVGRISFLLENDEKNIDEKQEQVILLRSSSKCVDIKKNDDQHGFWKLKRLFRKKKDKCCNEVDEKSDIIVSRSRSLCSFRNVETDDGGSDYRFSSAKISDVTTGGLFFDSDHEPRKSTENGYDFKNLRKRLQVKESHFNMDDSAFIDLKVDLSSSSSVEKKLEFSGHRLSNMSDYGYDSAASMGNLRSGSCRIKEYDRRMKRGNKVWKWIFRQTSSVGRKSISKSDEINSNLIIKS